MKQRTWSVIVTAGVLMALGLWWHDRSRSDFRSASAPPAHPAVSLLTQAPPSGPGPTPAAIAPASAQRAGRDTPEPHVPYRLANTSKRLADLLRDDRAILLRNALIDTASGTPVPIPANLRAGAEPGAYLVQARGQVDEGFLQAVEAEAGNRTNFTGNYFPNNAFLVPLSAAAADRLAAAAPVQAVVPWEPYYKLDPALLPAAVDQTPLTSDRWLSVTVFPGQADMARAALAALGAGVQGESRSPFGPQLIVTPPAAGLAAVASLPGVQLVEAVARRTLMNDLTRVALGVSADTTNTANYLNLTGSNVWVNLNDTGVDATNPDLAGRVFGDSPLVLVDTNGHGTHVAGTIASSGLHGPDGTNASGSVSGASFRGLAPAVKLFALGVDSVFGPAISDAYLIETAAQTNYTAFQRTNALISNNSWGYVGQYDYTSSSASYDAATRDALPETTGSQPMLYVFAAGNDGAGNDVGSSGEPGTINSPATAKNVITVGAIESPRQITNLVVTLDNGVYTTNTVWLGETDSSDEVAAFSSRGNVGIGTEGLYGRFKPDLVAPGTFVVSTRSKDWNANSSPTNVFVTTFAQQSVDAHAFNDYSVLVPTNTASLVIEVLSNQFSGQSFPALPIYLTQDATVTNPPLAGYGQVVLNAPAQGVWYYEVGNNTDAAVKFDLRTVITVPAGSESESAALAALNSPLGPYYRFDTGTSSSAAAVSGLLALVEEFFEQQLKRSYSPALLKALLINGASSLSPQYSFPVRGSINYQGWGQPLLSAVLPAALTNTTSETTWPLRWVDQSATNSLVTGQSHLYNVILPEDASDSDLRVTLVWTDPPGNPAASIKLVNDLDLIVSNNVSGEVFAGNDFAADSNYTRSGATNAPSVFDNINNVENVFLRRPIGTNYTILVVGRRINVNAVTAAPVGIAQDYALAVSTTSTNALGLAQAVSTYTFTNAATVMTNGIPLLYQRAGADSPLLNSPIGSSNQWHFYAFTNTMYPGSLLTNGPYVAFATFSPPNLAVPRLVGEADIDLYVTRTKTDPNAALLLTLDPLTVTNAFKSLSSGGTELVAFTNADLGEIFYVGVKSEDQQAVEYGLVGLSSSTPFNTYDQNGNMVVQGLPVPAAIPDGSPIQPGAVQIMGIAMNPIRVGEVVVRETIAHQDIGDLVGNLSHGSTFVVLNDHTRISATTNGLFSPIYDDSSSGEFPTALPTDGPGSLNDFLGQNGSGLWMLTMVDNGISNTGAVQNFTLRISPMANLLLGVYGSVVANQWRYYLVDVPADASKLTVTLSETSGPLDLYLRQGQEPTTTVYDKAGFFNAPGGAVSIGVTDIPPLTAGLYYVGVFNPTGVTQTYFLRAQLELNLPDTYQRDLASTNSTSLGDDVTTVATNTIPDARIVTSVKVGLRVQHPRLSDLSFHLVNPQGTRVLVEENRGGTNWTELGYESVVTNYHHVALTYTTNTGLAALYLDGQLQAARNIGVIVPDTAGDLFFGYNPAIATNNPAGQYFGLLDEVDLYNRALEPSEILGIYKFGGAGKPTNNLVSRWPFDGNGADVQGTNVATITGATFVPGDFGEALKFVSPGDRVQVTNQGSLDVGLSGGFTFDAWIAPNDLATPRPIAVWSNGTNHAGVAFSLIPGTDTNSPPGLLTVSLPDTAGSNHVVTATQQGLILTNAVLTNLVYATFTDDTNLALVPIKFATPATNADYTLTNQFISGFEGVSNVLNTVDFTAGDQFDGWTVITNFATVLNAPPLAHTGTNLLVLRSASLTRTLPTTAGKTYQLQFVHRQQPAFTNIISWWPGDGNALDIVGTNNAQPVGPVEYAPGMVGQGFHFTANDYLSVPATPSLNLTSAMTVETWFNLGSTARGGIIGKRAEPTTLTSLAANYGASVTPSEIDLWYNDLWVTNSVDPGAGYLENGFELVNLSPPPAPGQFHHLAGTFQQISASQVEMQLYLDGELRSAQVLPGVLARTTNLGPLLIGTTIPGVDDFNGVIDELTFHRGVLTADQIAQIYEMNAVGKARPPFNPQTQVVLDGAITNLFNSDSTWQTNTINFLASTNGTELEVQSLQPGVMLDSFELTEAPATYFLPEEPFAPFVGESALGNWLLEVTDSRVGATNLITPELIKWQLDLTYAPVSLFAVSLTNGVPYTNTAPAGQARYFIVDVPRSATRATNSLTAAAPVDLWFNQNGVPSGDPTLGDFHLLTNTTAGIVVLATNGTYQASTNGLPLYPAIAPPVLQPGQRYYLAVTNSGAPSTFVIRVDFDALDTNVVGVTPLGFGQTIVTNIAVTNALQYYVYNVTTNAQWASFEVYPTNGDVNLYLRKATPVANPLPTPQVFDYASENPGTNAEIIRVTQDSLVPLGSGPWYLGVLNADTVPVQYSIRVVESVTNLVQVIPLTAGVPLNQSVDPGSLITKYFLFTVANSSPWVEFDLYNLSSNATFVALLGNRPTDSYYDAMDLGAPDAPSRIVMRTNDALPSLNGDWYLAVLDPGTAPVTFTIEASLPSTLPIITILTNNVPVTKTIAADTVGLPAVLDYYMFTVAADATEADFLITPVNGNVDMLILYGALPDLTNFDYSANLLGTLLVPVTTNSTPQALTPGNWYIGIVNQDPTSVTYSIKASQVLPGAPTANVGITASNGVVTLTWAGTATQTFTVQYATNIPATGPINWITIAVPPTYANGLWTFTDDGSLTGGPAPFKLYRVLAGSAPSPPTFSPTLSLSGTVATLTWTANAGLNFEVQYAAGIPASGTLTWSTLTGPITYANGVYTFTDDGTQSGGFTGFKMYRVVQLP
jgi:subtilisin-like proprotein convertase family protein